MTPLYYYKWTDYSDAVRKTLRGNVYVMY